MTRCDLLFGIAVVCGLLAPPAFGAEAAAENVARGASYKLWPQPTYRHCTDAGDNVQLTDGQTTSAYFWTQRGTVGWQHVQYAAITVDLGKLQPIAGVSMTTAAGVAGVTWPMAVHILVSDDGRAFRDVGELVALDHKHRGPWPEGYAIRRLATDELRTRGRYVQLVVIPLSGGPYLFTDEVEVFRGDAAWCEVAPEGPIVDARQIYAEGRISRAVQKRFANDARAVEQAIGKAASLAAADRRQLQQRLDEARRACDAAAIPGGDSFRAVLPIGDAHAALFAVQADLGRRLGRAPLTAWVPDTWDPVDPFGVPLAGSPAEIEVHAMRGEYRAAALNLANTTDRTLDVRLRFQGLPGSPAPDYLTVHEVQWTDTSQGVPIAAALPEASRDGQSWRVSVPPGLLRQVWLTFHPTTLEAAEYRGALTCEAEGLKPLSTPVRVRVWPLDFPAKTTLQLGGWSYTDRTTSRGVTAENRRAFLDHLQSHHVNAPWATSGVMKNYRFDKDDPGRVQLDTRAFDNWIALWPDARRYLVFLSVAHYSGTLKSSLGGAEIGSPEFDQRVGTWISAWVRHLRSKGIPPEKLGLLIHDEPHEGSDIAPLLAWARAINRAEPGVIVWEDPTYRKPATAPPELFEVCDVLCPNRPMWLASGDTFATFYGAQRKAGRTLQLYSCSGPAKLLDPYSYHRLQAWHCWQAGATGSFFWAFGDNGGASSFNEYFARSGPYTPLFLDKDAVVAGKHMEAIRESAQDYEYFVMLEAAIARAKAAGRSDDVLRRAEALLETGAAEVLEADGAAALRWHEPKDRRLADRLRVRLLEALVSLNTGN